jgi:hypothetical protein
MRVFAVAVALIGCGQDSTETGTAARACSDGTPAIEIGEGASTAFSAFIDGQQVGTTSAPQGGPGIQFRAKVTGLEGDTDVTLLMESYLGTELLDRFPDEGDDPTLLSPHLYCQEAGYNLLLENVVGLGADAIAADFAGETVTLTVTVTHEDGTTAVGSVDVVITPGA